MDASRRLRRGFTLLELMLVVLLMGIVAGAAVVNLKDRQDSYALGAAARDLAAALRFAATQARMEGVGYRVRWNPERSEYRVEVIREGQREFGPAAGWAGLPRLFARGVRVSAVRPGGQVVEAMPEAVEFGPDGSGFWGTLELRGRGEQAVGIRILPWTGQVVVEEQRDETGVYSAGSSGGDDGVGGGGDRGVIGAVNGPSRGGSRCPSGGGGKHGAERDGIGSGGEC